MASIISGGGGSGSDNKMKILFDKNVFASSPQWKYLGLRRYGSNVIPDKLVIAPYHYDTDIHRGPRLITLDENTSSIKHDNVDIDTQNLYGSKAMLQQQVLMGMPNGDIIAFYSIAYDSLNSAQINFALSYRIFYEESDVTYTKDGSYLGYVQNRTGQANAQNGAFQYCVIGWHENHIWVGVTNYHTYGSGTSAKYGKIAKVFHLQYDTSTRTLSLYQNQQREVIALLQTNPSDKNTPNFGSISTSTAYRTMIFDNKIYAHAIAYQASNNFYISFFWFDVSDFSSGINAPQPINTSDTSFRALFNKEYTYYYSGDFFDSTGKQMNVDTIKGTTDYGDTYATTSTLAGICEYTETLSYITDSRVTAYTETFPIYEKKLDYDSIKEVMHHYFPMFSTSSSNIPNSPPIIVAGKMALMMDNRASVGGNTYTSSPFILVIPDIHKYFTKVKNYYD